MIKMFITLQELRRRIYCKAKADKAWRFWGIYVHVCKLETLKTPYNLVSGKWTGSMKWGLGDENENWDEDERYACCLLPYVK